MKKKVIYQEHLYSEYDKGYQARINKQPFDSKQSQEWQNGWMDANSLYQMID